jgi:hypothetical protein
MNNNTKIPIRQITPDQTAETIGNIAKGIREASTKIRETIKTIHCSGAICEFAQAIYEATLAARETAKEINETSKDLKEYIKIKDAANAMEETMIAANDTLHVVENTMYNIAEESPKSRKKVHKGSGTIKQEITKRTSKIKSK